jgi:hypothetical protein
MGHFAKVVDGKVTEIIVAEPEFFDTFVDSSPGTWLQTSYNTHGGVHTKGGTPLRGNYAGIGYHYDAVADVFYSPQPYASWVLSPKTFLWESPIAMPKTGGPYNWDEATQSWVAVTTGT